MGRIASLASSLGSDRTSFHVHSYLLVWSMVMGLLSQAEFRSHVVFLDQ